MTSEHIKPPGRARTNVLLDGGVTLVNLIVWIVLWQRAMLLNDDYLAAARGGGGYHGQSTLTQIWNAYVIDYTIRNGRAADELVKAVLALGSDTWRFAAPIALVALAYVTWRLVLALTRLGGSNRLSERGPRLLAYIAICGIPLAMAQVNLVTGPVMVFFFAAVMGYGVSLALALTGITLVTKALLGELRLRWIGWLALPCLFLAGVIHELSGIVGVTAVIAIALAYRRSLRLTTFWAALAGAVAGLTVFLLAPARSARTGAVLTHNDQGLIARVMNGVASFWETGGALIIVALLALCLLAVWALRELPRTRLRQLSTIAAGVALVLAVTSFLVTHEFRAVQAHPDTHQGGLAHAGILLLACTFLCALALALAYAPILAQRIRPMFVLAMMAAASIALPVALGLSDGRPYYHALYLIGVMAIAAFGFGDSIRGGATRIMLTAAVGALLALSLEGAFTSWIQLEDNRAVWLQAEQQLISAGEGQRTEVDMPTRYPDLSWAHILPRPSEVSNDLLRNWFGIDSHVTFRWLR